MVLKNQNLRKNGSIVLWGHAFRSSRAKPPRSGRLPRLSSAVQFGRDVEFCFFMVSPLNPAQERADANDPSPGRFIQNPWAPRAPTVGPSPESWARKMN